MTGNAGDHKLVYELLRAANQAPAYETFLAWLDEPTYEPLNRLLVKRDSQLVAHVQLLDRVAWFHSVKVTLGGVEDLVALPEYRDFGYERMLLSAAEQSLRGRQAVVAFAHTDRPDQFRSAGWNEAVGQRHTMANVSDILSRLSQSPPRVVRRHRPLQIRLWRQVELDSLRNVYHRAAAASWGAVDRSEAYWRWLVGRRAYDELIVAIHGRDNWDDLGAPTHIVGYAMTRRSQVVELATLPAFSRAAESLLARACQDAIERDHSALSLHVPTSDPLHDVMLSAGGSWVTCGRGRGTLMLKLLDPVRWVEGLHEVLVARANAAGLILPIAINFDTGRRKYRLELTRHGVRLKREDATTADVTCLPETFADLLLGNVDVSAAQYAGGITFGEESAAVFLAGLFPRLPLWQSQLDTLRF